MKMRIGLGSCGIAAGAQKVKHSLEAELANRDINMNVQSVGCGYAIMNLCWIL